MNLAFAQKYWVSVIIPQLTITHIFQRGGPGPPTRKGAYLSDSGFSMELCRTLFFFEKLLRHPASTFAHPFWRIIDQKRPMGAAAEVWEGFCEGYEDKPLGPLRVAEGMVKTSGSTGEGGHGGFTFGFNVGWVHQAGMVKCIPKLP